MGFQRFGLSLRASPLLGITVLGLRGWGLEASEARAPGAFSLWIPGFRPEVFRRIRRECCSKGIIKYVELGNLCKGVLRLRLILQALPRPGIRVPNFPKPSKPYTSNPKAQDLYIRSPAVFWGTNVRQGRVLSERKLRLAVRGAWRTRMTRRY